MPDLQGKKVVIIGGSSGIGLATTRTAAEQGALVVVAARSEKKLQHVRETVQGNIQTHQLDVTNEHEIQHFFAAIGQFNHLVTSVTTSSRGAILDTEVATVRHWFETKFWGQYTAAKHGAGYLNANGSITLFSGAASSKPALGMTAIAAQNGAVEAFARALAFEVAPSRVNVISPGFIDTPMWDRLSEEERGAVYTTMAQRLPVGRVGTAEDCAHAVLFLMTNEFVTGTVLHVNGGSLLV